MPVLDVPVAHPAAEHVYALTLEYDGSGFSGWQRQPGRRTVEGELLLALVAVTGEQPAVTAAGRTDAGAHAHGQVVGCTLARAWDSDRLGRALNANLPEDIVVVGVAPAPRDFHARFDAIARSYRYVVTTRRERMAISRQYAWAVRGPLDLAAMREAALVLTGNHDFAAFGRSPRPGGTTVRTVFEVDVRVVQAPEPLTAPAGTERAVVVIDVEADAFLYGMMRSLAGALVAVGDGRIGVDDIVEMVENPPVRRAQLPVAPAHGLHQWSVKYMPELS